MPIPGSDAQFESLLATCPWLKRLLDSCGVLPALSNTLGQALYAKYDLVEKSPALAKKALEIDRYTYNVEKQLEAFIMELAPLFADAEKMP